MTDWVGTELESEDTCELELSRNSRTRRRTQQPRLISVLSAHYRTTNFMGTKWIPPDKHNHLKQQCVLSVGKASQLRTISPAAQTDSELGNSALSAALGHHQEIQFSRWAKNLLKCGVAAWLLHITATLKESSENATKHQTREMPRAALQGARWLKFPDESLQQWKIFRISEHGKMKS